MLYMLNQRAYTEVDASDITGLELVKYKKELFKLLSRNHDLNNDSFFRRCCGEIDKADIPYPNVLRDIYTGTTHSFDIVSGGVMALWLLYYYNTKYLMPTRYFGENCYQILLDISKEKDIYVYDDADMLSSPYLNQCSGVLTDYKSKRIVCSNNWEALMMAIDEGH